MRVADASRMIYAASSSRRRIHFAAAAAAAAFVRPRGGATRKAAGKKMSVEQRRSIDKKTKQKPTMSNSNAIRSPFPLPDISFNYMLGTMA